jgi:hypothetical protein
MFKLEIPIPGPKLGELLPMGGRYTYETPQKANPMPNTTSIDKMVVDLTMFTVLGPHR